MTGEFTTSKQTSAGITLIRPFLIILVTLAHVPGIDSVGMINRATELGFDSWFGVFLKGVLSKGGVPLLSLFSGYLAVYSLEKYGYFKLCLKKAERLVWPLFWANLLFIILIIYPGQSIDPSHRPDLHIYPFNWLGWFQATFAYHRIPANPPLYFLKDLYTCFLLIPILFLVAKVRYLNILVIPWMAYKCIYLKSVFIFPVFPTWFFRFDIVFAFYLGILLFHWNKDLVFNNRPLNLSLISLYAIVCGLTSAFYVVNTREEYEVLYLWLDFIVKISSVLGCVAIMSLLSARQSWLSRVLTELSPYSYPLFLTHVFIFIWFERLFSSVFGKPVFFDISGSVFLLVILSAAILAAILLDRFWFRMLLPLAPWRRS